MFCIRTRLWGRTPQSNNCTTHVLLMGSFYCCVTLRNICTWRMRPGNSPLSTLGNLPWKALHVVASIQPKHGYCFKLGMFKHDFYHLYSPPLNPYGEKNNCVEDFRQKSLSSHLYWGVLVFQTFRLSLCQWQLNFSQDAEYLPRRVYLVTGTTHTP